MRRLKGVASLVVSMKVLARVTLDLPPKLSREFGERFPRDFREAPGERGRAESAEGGAERERSGVGGDKYESLVSAPKATGEKGVDFDRRRSA